MIPRPERIPHRWLAAGFWTALVGLLWGIDTLTKLEDRARTGVGLDDFRLYTEQATSAAAALVMVLFVAWWLARFPFDRERWARTLAAHVLGSVLFAIGHYALMVLLRVVVFSASGRRYLLLHDHFDNLVFEYQKDIKIYLGMVGIIAVYRHLRRRHADAAVATAGAAPPGRMLVQTGSGERLLDVMQIDYLQAARNYVSVHAAGREYIVRETLANLEARLAPGSFIRTHRSYLVNLERIAEVRPTDAGAYEIRIEGGATIPLSRGFRDAVRGELRRRAEAR